MLPQCWDVTISCSRINVRCESRSHLKLLEFLTAHPLEDSSSFRAISSCITVSFWKLSNFSHCLKLVFDFCFWIDSQSWIPLFNSDDFHEFSLSREEICFIDSYFRTPWLLYYFWTIGPHWEFELTALKFVEILKWLIDCLAYFSNALCLSRFWEVLFNLAHSNGTLCFECLCLIVLVCQKFQ